MTLENTDDLNKTLYTVAMQSVDIEGLEKALSDGGTLFDTRSLVQQQRDGLPGRRPISLEEVQEGTLPDLPKDTPIYLICERGQISELVGLYLEEAGFSEVYNVEGGMMAWRALHSATRSE